MLPDRWAKGSKHLITVRNQDLAAMVNVLFETWTRHLEFLSRFPNSMESYRVIQLGQSSLHSHLLVFSSGVASLAAPLMAALAKQARGSRKVLQHLDAAALSRNDEGRREVPSCDFWLFDDWARRAVRQSMCLAHIPRTALMIIRRNLHLASP